MGPLALMAKEAGFNVFGSDLSKGAIYDELEKAGIEVSIGEQDGSFLTEKSKDGIDWFCYTSALPKDHPELLMAKNAGIKTTKRDDLTAFLVKRLGLKMIAVAGTHGKTTTTAMIVWAALKLHLPVAYLVGTTLGFAPSGAYKKGAKFFIYEADEYDRNFLKYHPWLAVIPAVSYDHPDIYPTREDYKEAFDQFKSQSQVVIENTGNELRRGDGHQLIVSPDYYKLAGEARRIDAALATEAVVKMEYEMAEERGIIINYTPFPIVEIMNEFPGVGRRFEKIVSGVYSDYAHHPEEIAATMGVAEDEKKLRGFKGIIVVYQPHQNVRQHEVRGGYKSVFKGADRIFWLPTYLTREDPNLLVLTPEDLIRGLDNQGIAEAAEANDELAETLRKYVSDNYMVLLMTAGPADGWLREVFHK